MSVYPDDGSVNGCVASDTYNVSFGNTNSENDDDDDDDDIAKFVEYALLICRHGHASTSSSSVLGDPKIWRKSLDWSIHESISTTKKTDEDELMHMSVVAVACGLLRNEQPTIDVDIGESMAWVLSLLLLIASSTSATSSSSDDASREKTIKMIQSFLCRLLAHYVGSCQTQEELLYAALMIPNNLSLPMQLQLLTIMAQDWKATDSSLRLSWIQLVLLPILTTTLTTSTTYLSTIQNFNSDGCNHNHNNLDGQNLLVVNKDDTFSDDMMQLGIESIICHTLWLQSESFAYYTTNVENSYGVTETTVTNLVVQIAQQCLRIASSCIIHPPNIPSWNNIASFLCKTLPHLQECLIEEISAKPIQIYQISLETMLTTLIMDVFHVLSHYPKQQLLVARKYHDESHGTMIAELYEEVIEFTISLEVALLEKNHQKQLSKQVRECYLWILLWGLSQSQSLETVLIPAIDSLPQLFSIDISLELVDRTLHILIDDYIFILKENSISDHVDYFFETTQNTVSAISNKSKQWFHIIFCLQHKLNNFINTFANTGQEDSFWGIVTCLDFLTQVVSATSNIQSDKANVDDQDQQQPITICPFTALKQILQNCQPHMRSCGNKIGEAMAKLLNNLGHLIMNVDSNCQCIDVGSIGPIKPHGLDLLKYCHELVYLSMPPDLSNATPGEYSLFEHFCKVAETISQFTAPKLYLNEYVWDQNDQFHPFNALLHIIAKLTLTMRESKGADIVGFIPSMLLLVYTATKYTLATFVKTKNETAIQLFCVDHILPLIESSCRKCDSQGISCVFILIQIFSSMKASNNVLPGNDSAIVFLRNLDNPLNIALIQSDDQEGSDLLAARTTLALLVIQCSSNMMKSSANTQEIIDIHTNVLSKCLEIVNQSMHDIILSNDGGSVTRLAIELKNIIEDVCVDDGNRPISDQHCTAFLKIFEQLVDLMSREIIRLEEVKTIEEESWSVSFVEACLWAARATLRTEIILHQPPTFSILIQLCVHILGTYHWQSCVEGRACKASLECLKWAFWCCCSNDGTSEKKQRKINDCLTLSFRDETIIRQILYTLGCGSLGFTCSMRESSSSFEGQPLIRGKLQRAYVSCLYIVLFGDANSIHPELKNVFRTNDNVLKHCTSQCITMASRCDVPIQWVYDGLMNSNKGVHDMWAFVLKVRKVVGGETSIVPS